MPHTDISSVCILGLGYIGLPTAALIASRGVRVIGVDTNPEVVETVGRGAIHIAEADLDGLVQKCVLSGQLSSRLQPDSADVFLIAVPTPLSRNRRPIVDHVMAAAHSIAPFLKAGSLVILESTCPIGTTEKIRDLIADKRPDLRLRVEDGEEPDVYVAYCPERVLPGRILAELVQNDRCIGGLTPFCSARARKFYELFVNGTCIETKARTAEMVKLTENAYRDTNIAFANELSMICDEVEVEVWDVIQLANRHPRVNILNPGPGVGGHCIAVDPWFIVEAAPSAARLIRTSREVNDGKADYVFDRIKMLMEDYPDRDAICLGLTFKANVDDLRESPALEIVERLAKDYGKRVSVVDPFVKHLPVGVAKFGVNKVDLDDALKSNGIVIVLVDHEMFRRVPSAQRDGAIVYDTRGIWRTAPEGLPRRH
jgi:UDP-N-acetyl-D-mannosaminuronic acid dehydrogenase